eukprot:CAMPEP_0172452124 /NCGR_PEP_ID=MMETSP1065-20121228/9883_1 /TAXON_ID=265537 /ORGANISM="Amphiprora paludosa, Strain CCMP125" /LENGTH=36 /DNA_ID= /DNA_START= /DNA_END= /DNA_ORIENTATION=
MAAGVPPTIRVSISSVTLDTTACTPSSNVNPLAGDG